MLLVHRISNVFACKGAHRAERSRALFNPSPALHFSPLSFQPLSPSFSAQISHSYSCFIGKNYFNSSAPLQQKARKKVQPLHESIQKVLNDGIKEEYINDEDTPKRPKPKKEKSKRGKKVKVEFQGRTFYQKVNETDTFKKLLGDILHDHKIPVHLSGEYYLLDSKYVNRLSPERAKSLFHSSTELQNSRFLCMEESDDISVLRIMHISEFSPLSNAEINPPEVEEEGETQPNFDHSNKSKSNYGRQYNANEKKIIQELERMFGGLENIQDLRGLISVMQDGVIEEKIWKFCFSDYSTSQITRILLLQHSANVGGVVLNFKAKIKYLYSVLISFSTVATQIIPFRLRTILKESNEEETFDAILPEFLKYFRNKFIGETIDDMFEDNNDTNVDLCSPHLWYSKARSIKRTVVLHIGPTNSGKTYSALEDLKSSESGIYCGPLRILANEIYEKLVNEGIEASLITGQQKKLGRDSKHVSCTVEMADVNTLVDCAVVDEIQMITDPHRGWAWTRAVLGIPAKTLHLCGNESVVGIIRNICNKIGDELVVKTYNRLSPLTASLHPINSISELQKGDCVIAFSRKLIYDVKSKIEQSTNLRCSIVHGKLPPESRNQQASLFNSQKSGYDLLVASDAIGMGLNLNIKRVLFLSTLKYDGQSERPLTVSEIKQIAGRAGRFSGTYQEGITAGFSYEDSLRIARAIHTDLPQLSFAGLKPEFEQIESFVANMGEEFLFSEILQKLNHYASLDNDYFLCHANETIYLASLIDYLDMPLRDRYTFTISPTDIKDKMTVFFFKKYAKNYAMNLKSPFRPVKLGFSCSQHLPNLRESFTKSELQLLNSINLAIDSYLWLANHFPDHFTDVDNALEEQQLCHSLTEKALHDMTIHNKSNRYHRVKQF